MTPRFAYTLLIITEIHTVPAVSKISSIHCCPSTSTCFRYESSIVGSYFSTNIPWTNWTVRADFPTPPEPSTTILYSRILLWIGRNLSLCKKKLQKNIKLCESDLLHLWREILPCQLLRLIMLWYLRKKCNSPFVLLFFKILEGFWLAAYLSQPIRRGKKYDLTGFFENTRWRKLFQNCTIFQFLHPYEFCLYLFLRGVNGKGWNWLNYAINFSFNANPMGVKFHNFFFRENIIL